MKKIVDFFFKKSSKLAYFWFLQVQISTEVGHIIYGLKGLTETKSKYLKSNFQRYYFLTYWSKHAVYSFRFN